ncbi:hypothetical protein Bbelb_356120 [Branchiostoma belcheri]|nr:hypothetical protein Bbelb_356120 [Branchiostoma belcheri]
MCGATLPFRSKCEGGTAEAVRTPHSDRTVAAAQTASAVPSLRPSVSRQSTRQCQTMTGSEQEPAQGEEVKPTTPAEETIPLQDPPQDAEAPKDDPAAAEDPEGSAGSPSHPDSKLQRGRRSIKKKTQYIIREKHGPMRNAIPYMPMPVAIFLCVLNIVPGVGTFLSAFFTLCCPVPGMKDEPKTKPFSYCLLAAFVQIVLAIIIVGWILSFYWGVMFIVISSPRTAADSLISACELVWVIGNNQTGNAPLQDRVEYDV